MSKQRITKPAKEEKGSNTKPRPKTQQPSQEKIHERPPTSHFHSSYGLYLQPFAPSQNALYPNPLLQQFPFPSSNIIQGANSYANAQLPVSIGANFLGFRIAITSSSTTTSFTAPAKQV